jgi:moderate conductance mechanosensitive channel
MIYSEVAADEFDPQSPRAWLDWFTGTPLRLLLIVAIGAIVLFILRRAIRTVTEHLAKGSENPRGLAATDVGAALLSVTPLVAARRAQRARTIGSVLRSTASLVVGAVVFLMLLDEVGVNIVPLLASAGVAGVAFGFGAQSLVKDFLSGTFMLFEDQYGVGDLITIGDVSGTVEAVALRVTKVRDDSGTLWFVRNGEILRVGNRTQGWARAVVEVAVAFDADIDRVRALLTEAGTSVRSDPMIGTQLREDPEVVGIETLTASSVVLKLQVMTAPSTQWDVARALREAVRESLQREGIALAG